MADLAVRVDDRALTADWTGDTPETRAALEAALPLSGQAARWGDELSFSTPVDVPAEDARIAVPVGALASWRKGTPSACSGARRPRATATRPGPPRR